MDFINKGKEALSGGNNNNTQAPAQGQPQGGAGQEDYGDKGRSSLLSSSVARAPSPLPSPSRFRSVHQRDRIGVVEQRLILVTKTGLDFIEKKTGHTMGRDTNEKITDGARGLYEKATGYVSLFSPPSLNPPLFPPSLFPLSSHYDSQSSVSLRSSRLPNGRKPQF